MNHTLEYGIGALLVAAGCGMILVRALYLTIRLRSVSRALWHYSPLTRRIYLASQAVAAIGFACQRNVAWTLVALGCVLLNTLTKPEVSDASKHDPAAR